MLAPVAATPTRPLMPASPLAPGRPMLGTAISFTAYLRPSAEPRPVIQADRLAIAAPAVLIPQESPPAVQRVANFLTGLGLKGYSLETFRPFADQALAEYRRLGADFQPTFSLDWGSYVDDNSTEVHLSLLKLNKPFRSLAQRGMVDPTLIHLVRHELAHAFLNTRMTPQLHRDFEATFGIDRDYDVSTWTIAKSNLRRPGPDFVSGYATTHPHEDFAETMALYVKLGGEPVRIAGYIVDHGGSDLLSRKFAFVKRLFVRGTL